MNRIQHKLIAILAIFLVPSASQAQHSTRWVESTQSSSCSPEKFNKPSALAVDGKGGMFIAEASGPEAVEWLDVGGVRKAVLHAKELGADSERISIAYGDRGDLFIAAGDRISRLPGVVDGKNGTLVPILVGQRGGKSNSAGITSIAIAPGGDVVFTRARNVMRLDNKGAQSIIAGGNAKSVSKNAKGTKASFASLQGVIALPDGSLLVADGGDLDSEGRSYSFGVVRAIDKSGNVSTFAGDYDYADTGNVDGPKADARMPYLRAFARLNKGGLVLVQDEIAMVRLIDEDGVMSTLFGRDKVELKRALLTAVTVDAGDNIYFSDASSGYLYKATISGSLFKLCAKN